MKEPKISHVKGPRKSKTLAILDRIREGMLCDGTICTGSERKEKKGKRYKYNSLSIVISYDHLGIVVHNVASLVT